MRQGTAKSLLQFYTAAVREEKFLGLMINAWIQLKTQTPSKTNTVKEQFQIPNSQPQIREDKT